ncbi:MAG: hypothetical protein AB1689_23765, partial [Thermodesulfobacteriota bacterium]
MSLFGSTRGSRVERAALALLALLTACSDQPATSALRIAVIDGATGEPTPARLELVDERGAAVLPDGTLRVLGDCDGHPATSWDDA